MLDLNDMAIFTKVAESQSFTKAAEKLGLPKSTVSRKVSQLEDRLGTRLLNRTTRRLRLTETGRQYFDYCAQMVEAAEAANQFIQKAKAQPSGVLRISAPLSFGNNFLQEAMMEFLQVYPQVQIEVILDNKSVDMVADDIDIAFRVGPLSDSTLIARKVGMARLVVCASPDYIEAHGVPKKPMELFHHTCIGHSNVPWQFSGPSGTESLDIPARIKLNDMGMIRLMALKGYGIGAAPAMLIVDDVANGSLVPLLSEYPFAERTLYMVYPSRRQIPLKLMAFVDFILEKCQPISPWEADLKRIYE